jgi:hypothetical protein
VDLILSVSNVGSAINLKALRNLRVLRPLKSINAIPSMRRLVGTLISSLPQLANVTIFLSFIFILFGILGLQLFEGTLYNSCRVTPEPVNGVWEKAPGIIRHCSKLALGGYHCPPEYYCGNPLEYGISLEDDGVYGDITI